MGDIDDRVVTKSRDGKRRHRRWWQVADTKMSSEIKLLSAELIVILAMPVMNEERRGH